MKGEIKGRQSFDFVKQVICVKGCSASYILWKFNMISTFCTETAIDLYFSTHYAFFYYFFFIVGLFVSAY